jgi:hypothetical protein
MTDPIALVTEATEPRKFNVLEAAKGRSYPQDILNIYTDAEAAYQVNLLERKINAHDEDDAELEALIAEQNAFKSEVKGSILTFHLRGINPGLIRSISDEAHTKTFDGLEGDALIGRQNEWSNLSILAAHIVSVTDVDGNVDDHKWNYDDVATLRDWLPEDEFDKITELMFNLSFAAQLFDVSVNADFS